MFRLKYTSALVAGVMFLFTSCKKELREEIFPASLTIVNAVNDNSSFISAYFGETQPKIYARLATIYNGGYFDYATGKMDQPIRIFRNNDTLNPEKPFLQNRLQLEPGGIFTHFIYGSSTQVKQKTVLEKLPARSLDDSVCNLRIINLFDNKAIDVVQLEPVPGTMVTNLAYEALSDFIKVPVTTSVKNFRFEIKDHATGATLATFTEVNIPPGSALLNPQWLFKARTMLVTGADGATAMARTVGHY